MADENELTAAKDVPQVETDTPEIPAEAAEQSGGETSADILAPVQDPDYQETDVFAFANNLVQYKDELKIELFFFNKNFYVYKTSHSGELDKQMEPIFIDDMLEYILEGVDKGLIVREFESAEAEENVLQRTKLKNVEKAVETLNWIKSQEQELELFNEEDHDIKRIKGVIARVSHKELKKAFYVIKALPQAQVIKGRSGWILRDGKLKQFDADAALSVPKDNQLLVLDQDMYVFNQGKLKSLFGYDAKEASIAAQKVAEIEANFNLSFAEGVSLQSLVKGKRATIKKLQKIEPSLIKQEELMAMNEDMNIGLMEDDNGAIIIMDDRDLTRFVNLLNDDYVESNLTGQRYEIKSKKLLKPADEDELLKEVLG